MAQRFHSRNRVQAGVRFLDAHLPKWRQRVKRETLDIGDGNNCIGGQLCRKRWLKSQSAGKLPYEVFVENMGLSRKIAIELGIMFNLSTSRRIQEKEISKLNKQWQRALAV